MTKKAAWFGSLCTVVIACDVVSKRMAEQALQPQHVPHDIVGDLLALYPDLQHRRRVQHVAR